MKQSVLPLNEKDNNQNDFTENKSGILSDELIDAISSIPKSEVILYQKVDQSRNIIPFHRNYKEGWEGLTIAQMLQLNCLKKIKLGQYSKDTFTIEVHNMDEGKLYHWQSDFTNLKFEVENIGGDDNED
jgi:hypothetical protein